MKQLIKIIKIYLKVLNLSQKNFSTRNNSQNIKIILKKPGK